MFMKYSQVSLFMPGAFGCDGRTDGSAYADPNQKDRTISLVLVGKKFWKSPLAVMGEESLLADGMIHADDLNRSVSWTRPKRQLRWLMTSTRSIFCHQTFWLTSALARAEPDIVMLNVKNLPINYFPCWRWSLYWRLRGMRSKMKSHQRVGGR